MSLLGGLATGRLRCSSGSCFCRMCRHDQAHVPENATAVGVVLPKYLTYLRCAPQEPAPQRSISFAAVRAIQRFTERKPRTA